MKHKNIFISFALADKPYADSLAKQLGNKGIIAFNESDRPPGSNWADELRRAINKAKAFVVLLSANSISSEGVMFEYGAAIATGKKVIPILIANGTWQLPQFWQSVQCLDGTKTDQAHLAEMIEAELLN